MACALDISKDSHITYAANGTLSHATVRMIAPDGLLVLDNGRTILSECVRCVSRGVR